MGSLLSYEDAIRILRDSARACPASVEEIPLAGSAHRVIAREVRAGFDVPSLDNSAMDGFAVRSCDLQSGWNEFPVSSLKIAGDLPDAQVREKTAVQIMTGAPLPQGGFDLIVKVEDVGILKDSTGGTLIRFDSISASAAHVRRRGSDFEKGDLLVRPGSRIDAKAILGLAALGCARVVVHRKPRVALISTGNELVPHDQTEVPEGAIRNSTAPYLMQALRELGCEVRNFGVVRDEASEKPEEFERALKAALSEGFDLILTTGAVSMGIHDFIRPSVERNGGRVLFHKVAIRPGKPVLFRSFRISRKPVSLVFREIPFRRSWVWIFCGPLSSGTIRNPGTKAASRKNFGNLPFGTVRIENVFQGKSRVGRGWSAPDRDSQRTGFVYVAFVLRSEWLGGNPCIGCAWRGGMH